MFCLIIITPLFINDDLNNKTNAFHLNNDLTRLFN